MRTALLILIGASALADWWSRLPQQRLLAERVERISKPLTTILVIVLAATADAPGARILVAVVALTCCLAGDVALMQPIDNFVAGLAAFLVGHLVFIALFVRLGLNHRGLAVIAAAGGVIVAVAVGRPILLAARQSQPSLTVPVAAYLVVIVSMAVFGWWTGRLWAIIGSTAFVLSDAFLGWQAFVTKRRYLPLVVMITYHAAIVALALSL
ncbi:MAG: lysoplasmalogenase [Ilumatobacteraceae bacterium]